MKKLITYLLIVCLSVGLYPILSSPPKAAAGGVGGGAYGAQVGVSIDLPILPDITVTLPPVAPVTLPVGGGGPIVNSVLSVSAGVPGFPVLSTGVITDTTSGVVTPGGSDAISSSVVNGLNVLSSVVTADTLVATANSTCNGLTASSSGSLVVTNLIVGGGPVLNGTIAPNTVIPGVMITLPVIGTVAATVTLNEQIPTGDGILTSGITVNAIHVVASGSVVLVGDYDVDIIVASASSSVICMANTPPTITPVAPGVVTRQQGSPGTVSTIATVSDPEDPASSLVVTIDGPLPTGITVTGITNTNGTITATVAADCSATPGNNTFGLKVTDLDGTMTTANLVINVTANTPPTVGAYPNSSVAAGQNTTVTPAAAPADNGSIVSVTATTVPAFTGTLSGNPATGAITVTNAAPPGVYTIDVVVTDDCGATTTASFTLSVDCSTITVNPPTLINGLTFIPYSATLSATGGSGSYTFSLASGTLPAGLTLSGNTISGTPNTAGASTFTVRATDGNGCFGERSYTLLIGSTGLMYYPLARPVRLLDTRPEFSPDACFLPNAPIPGGTVRTQPVRGTCKGLTIPPEAISITGNITSVQSGGGFLAIYPSDAPPPLVSNSNYMPNEIINNAFTVGIGADGAVKISVTTTTDVVVDVTGYYAAPSPSGLYFHPLPRPVRLLETRAGFTGCFAPAAPLQGGVDVVQQGTGTCQGLNIPSDARALVGNATTVNPVDLGYLTLYPADAARPLIASSNYNAGQTVNGPFTVGLSPSGQFKIFPQWTTELVIDITGYYSSQVNDVNGPGLLYSSLGAPLRLLDTRPGFSGCYTPGAPMTGGTVYTQETQSPCTNLTPAARALIGNATVVNTTAEGYLTFWPGDADQPLVATSNYVAGQVINRFFTVGLGPDGSFKRFAFRTTDLVVDISGFFAP